MRQGMWVALEAGKGKEKNSLEPTKWNAALLTP